MINTISILDKIKNIEGWLTDEEANLLVDITMRGCRELSPPHIILEVGSYQGKSTVLLGTVILENFEGAKLYAIDPHEGTVGAADQGIFSLPPSLEMFNKNVEEAGLSHVVELIHNFSFNVVWNKPITILFIDGLHDYSNVARDFAQFSDWVLAGGYIAFHDYSDYYPGVKTFVKELVATGNYLKISRAESLIVLQKIA